MYDTKQGVDSMPHLVAEQVFEGDDVLVLAQVAHDPNLPEDVLRVDAACGLQVCLSRLRRI